MGLFDWIRPSRPRRPEWEPRLSDALHETGSYSVSYDGWSPASLSGDPVLSETKWVRRRDAVRISEALIAIAPERADLAARMLEREGLRPRGTAGDWDAIERKLIDMAEASAEPKHVALGWPVVRPAYFSFLVDVGLLFAERAAALRPGLRLARADVASSPKAGTLLPFPKMVHANGELALLPVSAVLLVGGNAVVGDTRGGWLSPLLDPGYGVVTPEEKVAEVRAFWHRFVAEEGRRPTSDELVMFMVDSRYTEEDLPPELVEYAGSS